MALDVTSAYHFHPQRSKTCFNKHMNNGIPHDYTNQELACDLTGCTFFFDNHVSNKNTLKALFNGSPVLRFVLSEANGCVDAYVTLPDGVECIQYKNATPTSSFQSHQAHLSYHGRPKRKKISGEIHVKNHDVDPLSGRADRKEAPVASSSDIHTHPLPICRIELSESVRCIASSSTVQNFFHLAIPQCFFNTIEVHLSRRGYMRNIAAVTRSIPDEYSALFIHTSLHAFFIDRITRRPGRFPQALVLQTQNFELIVLAAHEYANPRYDVSTVRYFHTRDYFRDLNSRNIIHAAGGFFIDQRSHMPPKQSARRLRDASAPKAPDTGETD